MKPPAARLSPALFAAAATLAFFVSSGGPGPAQDLPRLPWAQQAAFSWDELAAHAGLAGIGAKTKDQFKLDVVFDRGRYASAIKAAISLTKNEWSWLTSDKSPHLLHPWMTNEIDNDTWKKTVDLGLPVQETVDVRRLNMNDKAVLIRRPDLRTLRLYMLSPNADGKSGTLYYFYNDLD
jgi:hypothetical protein